MALKYEVSPDNKLVTITASGALTRQDFDDLRSSLLTDERIGGEMALLLDADQADAQLTFTDLQEIAGRLQQIFDKGIGRVAIVARSTFVYSLAKTFGVFAATEPVRVKPFREVGEAVEWLQSAA